MTSIFKKSVNEDLTATINSLLQINSTTDQIAEEKMLSEGLIKIVKAPVKIVSGVAMMFGGVVLSPIPGLVGEIATKEKSNEEGTRVKCTGARLKWRKPKTPFYSTRDVTTTLIGKDERGRTYIDETVELLSRHNFYINFHMQEPKGSLKTKDLPVVQESKAKTTVTPFKLFGTGLGRIITGIFDPIFGIGKTLHYAEKKVVNHWKAKGPSKNKKDSQHKSGFFWNGSYGKSQENRVKYVRADREAVALTENINGENINEITTVYHF